MKRLPALALLVSCLVPLWTHSALADDEPKPIEIAELKRAEPVDFEKEVLPALTKNCLACHNAKDAEGDLVLETPQTILKGGYSGPAVVAGKSDESLLLKVAAHREEPIMPPADNGVDAKPLSSEQLGLLKLWIDQGAKGEVAAKNTALNWQSLPAGMNPIYAAAVTPDGRYVACSRSNQIFIYQVATGELVTRLTDPALVKSGLYQNRGVAHLDLVQSLAFSPDGHTLASGGFREAKLWRRTDNVRVGEVPSGGSALRSLAVSADGKLAATGDAAGTIKLWDLASLQEPRTLSGHSAAVTALALLEGGKLASVSEDKSLRLWNLADGAELAKLETPAAGLSIVVLPGGQLATGQADNVIRRYALPAEAGGAVTSAGEIAGHGGPVVSLAVLAGQPPRLVSGSADGTVRIWSLEENKQVLEIAHGAAVNAVAARPDGKQIASAGADSQLKLWNAADGKPWASPDKRPIGELKGDFAAQFKVAELERRAAFAGGRAADDKKALADAEAKIISTSQAVATTQTAKEAAAKTLKEKQDAVKPAADAKDAADKALAAAKDANTAAADTAAKAKAAAEAATDNAELAKANEEAAQAAAAADAAFKEAEKKAGEAKAALDKAQQELTAAESANSAAEQAATAAVANVKQAVNAIPAAEKTSQDSEAHLVAVNKDLEAAKAAAVGAEKPIRWLAYSADGKQLASAGENNLVRTWQSDTGVPIETYAGHAAAVQAAAITPSGVLSAAADGSLILWQAAPSFALERTIGSVDDLATFSDRVTALAFSPDGQHLATGGGEPSRDGELKIFNIADGTLVREIPAAHSDTVFGLEFSPDGTYLASSAADRFVKVFQVADGKLARSFEGHTHHVLDVTWKSDAKVLASAGADNVIKVWDFTTGDQLRTTPAFEKEVTAIAFVGASPQVLASSGDKTVRLVNTDNGKMERTYSGSADFMYTIATTLDGQLAISGGQDSTLLVWLVGDGQLLQSLKAPAPPENTAQQAANN